MPETISLVVTADIAAGPAISQARTITVDAYDKLSLNVAAGTAPTAGVEVELQPGGAGQVAVLIVVADRYDPDPLTFRVNGATADVTLDGPLTLIGTGAVGLLDAAPATLSLANPSTTADAQVHILIGRDATP